MCLEIQPKICLETLLKLNSEIVMMFMAMAIDPVVFTIFLPETK